MHRIKRVVSICVLSLFLLNVVTHAAIVSDNDGTAFVTKAEFDALKESFNKQVDDYNKSIDGKIDGAIASYLAGIKISKIPTNLFDRFVSNENDKPRFLNKVSGIGTSTQTMEVIINSTREHAITYVNNLFYDCSIWQGGYATIDNALYVNTAPQWNYGYSTWKTVWYNSQVKLPGDAETSGRPPALTAWGYYNSGSGAPTTAKRHMSTGANAVSNGSGSAWIYQVLNGKKCLKFYDMLICTSISADVWAHSHTDCGTLGNYYVADNTKGYTTELVVTANKAQTAVYGKSTAGTKYTDDSTNSGAYADITVGKTETNNGKNYLNCTFATSPTCATQVYSIDEDADLIQDSTTSSKSTDTSTFYDTYYTNNGEVVQSNTLSKATLKYYPLKFPTEYKKISEFAVNSISSVAGETIYNGEGFPILETSGDLTEIKADIVMKASSGTANIKYLVSDKKFINGDFDPSADIKVSDTVIPGSVISLVLKKSTEDFKNGEQIWINCYSTADGVEAILDSVIVK